MALQAALLHAAGLEAGRRNYQLLCVSCHGEEGDAVNYPNTVPLAGISRRYPPETIARLAGSFSGRLLHGKELEDIVAYMGTLRGSNNLADPGWLTSPHLLEMKAPRLGEFRVLDVRHRAAYEADHVANAVRVDSGPCGGSVESTAALLSRLAVTPVTTVVIYDENGGAAAACLWWRIRQAGHKYVSVLDGGWRRWREERRFTTKVVPTISPSLYQAGSAPVSCAGSAVPAEPDPEIAHRILISHLNGHCR
jgi:rhodanese-related sulfurtransferase